MELKQGILLLPEGAHKLSFTPLGQAEVTAALLLAGQQGYQRYPAIDEIDGNPVTLAVSRAHCLVGVSLKGLQIRTFAKELEDVLVPTFQKLPGTLETNLSWVPPNNMRVFLIVQATSDPAAKLWKQANVFLMAKSASAVPGGFFKLVLPNIYPDSRVCMGDHWPGSSPTLVGLLKSAIRQLNESQWNTDMLPHNLEQKTWKLFRFHKTTLQSVEPLGNWWDACGRVSRIELESFYGQ